MLSVFIPFLLSFAFFSLYLLTHQTIQTNKTNYTYSPTVCTITDYKFTFIYDDKEQRPKVHGVWPDGCEECLTCSYPSCCNIQNVIYTEPYDPSNFIGTNWFQTQTSDGCNLSQNKVTLFEHEYYKHISCTDLKTTTEFLNLVESLYNKYYDKHVIDNCKGYDEIWLDLNSNFEYIKTECH